LDLLKQKKHSLKSRKCLKLLVRPAGFESSKGGFRLAPQPAPWPESYFDPNKNGVETILRPTPFSFIGTPGPIRMRHRRTSLRPTDSKCRNLWIQKQYDFKQL